MERDPVRFVWRTISGLHAVTIALLVVAVPLGWLALDLIRLAFDDAIGGRAFAGGAQVGPFLRYAIRLPERMAENPIVLLPGLSLTRQGFMLATMAGLAAVALAGGLFAFLFSRIRAAIGEQAVRALRSRVLEGIISAPISRRDEARHAAQLAGEGVARENGFLGSAVLVPAACGTAIGVSLLYALAANWRLAAALVLAIMLLAWLLPRRLGSARKLADARLVQGAALRRLLSDLTRRIPALRVHGTAAQEEAQVAGELATRAAPLRPVEARAGLVGAGSVIVILLVPMLVIAAGVWFAYDRSATPGQVAAVAFASAVALIALDRIAEWRRAAEQARLVFREMADSLAILQRHARDEATASLPKSGTLVLEGVRAVDPSSGSRLSGIDLSLAFPSHVALIGERGSGARACAGVIGGAIEPSAGLLAFGGVDLDHAAPGERASRIALAGGETILLPGTLARNFLYGTAEPDGPELDRRLIEAATVAGLDRLIHMRGLAGTIDPEREPKLAADVVGARCRIHELLDEEGMAGLVDPFDAARYNEHATIGENILFGVPVGDTFRDVNLPSHAFLRNIFDSEGVTEPLAAMGRAIAASMVEIFADLPEGSSLFERYSFFSADERGYFEDLLQRGLGARRGAEGSRDRERLIGLAMRYNERRHRLGLLDEALEERLVRVRNAFAAAVPASLRPAVEFLDPDRICSAASLQDNLLFGRVADDRAGAASDVYRVVRRVLAERGLDEHVVRVGLDTRIDQKGTGLDAAEIAAIDLVRCLLRQPDILVVAHALEGLPTASADALVARLRKAQAGRGLIIVARSLSLGMVATPFDTIVRFERGQVSAIEGSPIQPADGEAVQA